MKKALLSVFAVCAGLMANAQKTQGYHKTAGYAADYFTIGRSLQNVYWWTQNADSVARDLYKVRADSFDQDNEVCIKRMETFNYGWTRDTAAQALKYTLTQPYGAYEPVGVSFGETRNSSVTLDLSKGNAYVKFLFTNTTDQLLKLTVALQDVNKRVINSIAIGEGNAPEEFYLEEQDFTIEAGSTDTISVDYNKVAGREPYYPNYLKDSCNRGYGQTKTNHLTFKYDSVAAVMFTVVKGGDAPIGQNAQDGYKTYRLQNATFSISQFRVGTMDDIILGLDDNLTVNKTKLGVYPNPVTGGVLYLGETAQNIKVVDVLGNVVLTAPSAKEVNVSNLNKGVYSLHSTKGSARFVVE